MTPSDGVARLGRVTAADVVAYYDRCEADYRMMWDLNNSLAMHIGYWDDSTRDLPSALLRQNQVLAHRAGIRASDRVLDAGCGVGGSAIYLARQFGCGVTGVTLSARQASTASSNARRHGVGQRTRFFVTDFAHTAFPDETFDVVWALESVCYAPDKLQFVREAYRILRTGGRLILADGFATKDAYHDAEQALMRRCLLNWAVPGLETAPAFDRYLRNAGFIDVSFEDVTATILPSTRRLFISALCAFPLGKVAEVLGLRDRVQARNLIAARYPHRLCRRNLIRYGIFYAVKPTTGTATAASAWGTSE